MTCNGCDKEIYEDAPLTIMVRLKSDRYYVVYSFCSYECRDEVYADVGEGGFSEELFEETVYRTHIREGYE